MLLYGTLEIDIAIMCACAPALHAFFRKYFGRPQDKGRPRTGQFSIGRRVQRRRQTDYDLEVTIPEVEVKEVSRCYSKEPDPSGTSKTTIYHAKADIDTFRNAAEVCECTGREKVKACVTE
jgi:hypothetical protein